MRFRSAIGERAGGARPERGRAGAGAAGSASLQAFRQGVDAALAFLAGLAVALGVDVGLLEVVEHNLFGGHEFGAGVGHFRREFVRDGGDAVAVAVEELAGGDLDAADVDGDVDLQDMAIAVGTDGAVGEAGEAHRLDLIEVAGGAAGDEADGAEGLVGGAHDFAEGGGHDGSVEVLEHNHWRAREFGERGDLLIEARVDVAGGRRERGTEGGGRGVTDHGGKLWEAGADAGVHVKRGARGAVVQFDDVANRWRIVLSQKLQVGCRDGVDFFHGLRSFQGPRCVAAYGNVRGGQVTPRKVYRR